MSKNYIEKNSFPEKDYNIHDLSIDKHISEKNHKVQIYDNDDAYMLNLENNKENESRENISDLDNYDKLKDREKENVQKNNNNNICDEIDDHLDLDTRKFNNGNKSMKIHVLS